jgi:hypothetical protein
MSMVNDSDVIEYLLGHYGIEIALAFYRLSGRPSTPISWSGP